jgi:hypothetical protein
MFEGPSRLGKSAYQGVRSGGLDRCCFFADLEYVCEMGNKKS